MSKSINHDKYCTESVRVYSKDIISEFMILFLVVFCTKTECVALNQTCTDTSNCTETVVNSFCDTYGTGQCACETGYQDNSGFCLVKKCVSEAVPNSSPSASEYEYNTTVTYICNPGYSHTGGDLIRRCQANETWSGTRPTCAKIQLGDTGCVNSPANSCEDPNAECRASDAKCVCRSDFYDDNGEDTMLGICQPKLGLRGNCSTVVNDSCSDPYAICKTDTKTCRCLPEYYDSNGEETANGTCVARRNLNEACEAGDTTDDQCKDQNAKCSSENADYRCTCNTGYHPEGLECIANKPLGGNCTQGQTGQCSDPNADCLASGSQLYACTCKPGFYDDNGFDAGGNCQTMGNLMVTDIQSKNINTNSFTVSWTEPSAYKSHVSRYSVSWSPGSTGELDAGNTTSAEVTGLPTPGAVYTVYVTTYNDETQLNSPRTVTVHKQQASKPSTPGPLNNTRSNLDVTDKSLKLVWAASAGEVSQYAIAILDGSVLKTYSSTVGSSNSIDIGFDSIKNGYRYDIRILAFSKEYDAGKTVISNAYMVEIKTRVQAPTKVTSFNCKETTDNSITVVWTPPEFPNGENLMYRIDVYLETNLNDVVQSENITDEVTNYTTTVTLEAGKNYQLRIFTSNEEFPPSNYEQVTCKTMDRMSDPPVDLSISNITSQYMVISWKQPSQSYGEVLGFVLQLKDERNVCQKEILIKCTDCSESINESALQGMCPPENRTSISVNKATVQADQLETVTGLFPDSTYQIIVAAVNRWGKGKTATETRTTLEEAPVKPADVNITNVQPTSFTVKWTKGQIRPGNTSYTIIVTTAAPAVSQNKTVYGFDKESSIVEGLEEYWNYSVTVMAKTSVGTASADPISQRTQPAAPGKVAGFKIITGDDEGGTYQTLIVEWKIPEILERNSEITAYTFIHNETTDNIKSSLLEAGPGKFSETIDVKPETYYRIEVYAINHQNVSGQAIIETIKAPAGVPDNKFEKSGDVVIKKEQVNDISQTTIKLPLNLAYFEQEENGKVVEHGVVVYAKTKSQFTAEESTDVLLIEFQTMENWKTASKKGYTKYRATNKQWLDDLKKGIRKRRADIGTDSQIYWKLGSEDCSALADDQFCNGPLTADTDYIVRLAVCTNRGCLLSREYGPFHTQPIPAESEAEADSTVIALSVCLSLVTIAFFVLVGYVLWKRKTNPAKQTSNVYQVPLYNIQSESSAGVYDELDTFSLDYQAISMSTTKLGSGQFGHVWKGNLKKKHQTLAVAVKIVKDNTDIYTITDLQKELETLKRAGCHPNVVQLHGYCTHNNSLYIVMEYMPGGDLRSYLHKARQGLEQTYVNKARGCVISQSTILQFAIDIAKGMAHLAERQIIHRDLAARNVLLDDRNRAKVSDFGLARIDEVYFKSSKDKIPVKWLAIESLLENKYTTKSDVWSFGVVLWEMTTLGGVPFRGIKGKDIADRLISGERLQRPENCGQELYEVMLRCWMQDPTGRPSFQDLSTEFQSMLDDSKVYVNTTLTERDRSIYDDATL